MTEKDIVFLKNILENIIDIEKFVRGVSKKELEKNKEKLNAIIRSIEIIGEASKNISEDFKVQHKEISWKEIIGTRDILTLVKSSAFRQLFNYPRISQVSQNHRQTPKGFVIS